MSNYILMENRQFVVLGPMNWRPRRFQGELKDLGIEYEMPPNEPNAYMQINETYEIFPVYSCDYPPDLDTLYEEPAGPFWTFDENNVATGNFNKVPLSLDRCKANIKNLIPNARYLKEISGIKITVQGQEVSVSTNRGPDRQVYIDTLATMGENSIVTWKFPEAWIELTKTDVTNIITSINNHVHDCFDWEKLKSDQVDAATTLEEVKALKEEISPTGVPFVKV